MPAGRHRRQIGQGGALPPAACGGMGGPAGRRHRCVPRPQQRALDHLLPYMNECFAPDPVEQAAARAGRGRADLAACATPGRPSSTPPWKTPRCVCRRPRRSSPRASSAAFGTHELPAGRDAGWRAPTWRAVVGGDPAMRTASMIPSPSRRPSSPPPRPARARPMSGSPPRGRAGGRARPRNPGRVDPRSRHFARRTAG